MPPKNKPENFEQRDYTLSNVTIERRSNGEGAKLVGHASVFDSESLDLGGFVEIVKRGAFERSLKENDVHAFVNHNSDMVIGRNVAGTLRLSEDETGLRTEIDLPDTTYARDLAVSVERGDITGMSFGFRVRAGGQTIYERDDGLLQRELTDIDLMEVSTTPIPAYPATDVARRSLGLDTENITEEDLSNYVIDASGSEMLTRMKSIRDSIVLREKRSQDWVEVRETSEDSVEILLYDTIGLSGTDPKDFVQELNKYKKKKLNIRLNSAGGSVMDGSAIYNALRQHEGHVTVNIDGLAASMAGIIAMAGDEVRMNQNAFFMMHNASTCAIGDATAMEKEAEFLRKINKSLARTLSIRSGKDVDEILAMMEKETWLDAQEAKSLGFVDTVTNETRQGVRSHDVSHYRNVHPAYIEQRRKDFATKRRNRKQELLKKR